MIRRYALAALLALFVLALPAQALAAIKDHKINFDPPGQTLDRTPA